VELWSRESDEAPWPGEPEVLARLDAEVVMSALGVRFSLATVYEGTEVAAA
jgi:hypothetical protein